MEHILASLGLEVDEIRVYLFLLENGPIAAGAMAKKLGTPRSSLYGFLKRLCDKGFVGQSITNGITMYAAESPEKITLIFQQSIEKLENQQTAYKALLPDLLKKRSTALLNPTFQLFTGKEGMQNILKDMLLYSDMETQALWPIQAMVDILSPEFFRYHNKKRIQNKLYTRAIWPEKHVVDIKNHPYLGVGKDFLREIRVAPKQIDFTMGYWIYGTKVAFVSSRKESMGFIIESAELVDMLLAQFEVIWAMSSTLKVDPKDTEMFVKELKK